MCLGIDAFHLPLYKILCEGSIHLDASLCCYEFWVCYFEYTEHDKNALHTLMDFVLGGCVSE